MSLSVGRAKLMGALKNLSLRWERTKQSWDDPVSQRLEDAVINPLEPKVRSAVTAMEKMGELIVKARRDCQS